VLFPVSIDAVQQAPYKHRCRDEFPSPLFVVMSPLSLRSSSHRAGLPAGPNSASGVSGFLRRLSTPSNYTAIDPTSLFDYEIPDVLLRPDSLPTVHQYTLKSSAFIIVKSHALNAQDPPLLYFGEDITGYVILSPSDLSDMQRVDVVVSPFPSWYD
jgi:hypothetical protein